MKLWLPPFTRPTSVLSIGELIRHPSVDEMRAHVSELLALNPGIRAAFDCKGLKECRAHYSPKIIHCLPIEDEESYSCFLHEMGHLVSPKQQAPLAEYFFTWPVHPVLMDNELDAWRWARENALMWTPVMESKRVYALETYGYEEKEAA